jgi:1-acyl-sn-glycerol-3-phosphate acyltransferase
LRLQARINVSMARWIAGVRVTVEGEIPPVACIVVMNHQSVLDIPIGIKLVPGPYPVIPTRDRYKWGIPGISPIIRLCQFPTVSQKRVARKAEYLALETAANRVARGENSFLIFPEGHRTRDGSIGRFMRNGLRIALTNSNAPVYCLVVDGATRARTFWDGVTKFAGLRVHVRILGPFTLTDPNAMDDFIEMLRDRMIASLAQLRGHSDESAPSPDLSVASG